MRRHDIGITENAILGDDPTTRASAACSATVALVHAAPWAG
jgi:hypothetical protein